MGEVKRWNNIQLKMNKDLKFQQFKQSIELKQRLEALE